MNEKRNGLTFYQWMERVNNILMREYGVSTADLADFCSYDAWDSGISPREGAEECIANDGTFQEIDW